MSELPPEELLSEWLELYHTLAQYEVAGICFFLRPITRGEYRTITYTAGENRVLLEDELCNKSCLWPEYFDFFADDYPAGISEQLAQYVLRLSGLTEESHNHYVAIWQDKAYDQDSRNMMMILQAFPGFRISDLENMLPDEYYRVLTMAEWILRFQLKLSAENVAAPDTLLNYLMCTRQQLEDEMKRLQQQQEQHKLQAAAGQALGRDIPTMGEVRYFGRQPADK